MQHRRDQKILRLFLPAAAALALCLFPARCPAGAAQAGKQSMESLNVEIRPRENGDVTVRQIWRVRLEDRGKPYRNFYWTLPDDRTREDGFSDPSVYDNDRKVSYPYAGDIDPGSVAGDEMAGKCYRHFENGMVEFGWFMPAVEEGVRTFTLTYTIRNLMTVYSDTAELYLSILPENFEIPVENLKGTVLLPGSGKLGAGLWAWLHTDVRTSGIQEGTTDRVDFSAEGIPAETPVEIRVLADTALFPASTRKTPGKALLRIQNEEKRDAEEARERADREFRLGVLDAAGGAVFLLAAIVVFLLTLRKNRRVRVETPEYTRDIPPGNSPAGVANLYYFYQGLGQKQKDRIYSATLLSLARKGYVRFSGGKKEFSVELAEKAGNLPLTESEEVFYRLVSAAAAELRGGFTMKQFRAYAEKHAPSVNRAMEDFFTSSRREIAGRGYLRERPGWLSALKIIGGLLMVSGAAVFLGSGERESLLVYLPLGLLIAGGLLIAAGNVKMKLSQKGERDLGLWEGLKKYMLEFSRMTEYGVPQLSLWEEYLVYATMMGISGEVCRQLKMVYPQLSEGSGPVLDPSAGFLFYMFRPRFYGGNFAFGRGFGDSLGSALGEVGRAATRLSRPPVHGSFGGRGGFGGGGFGGGGFSGGGGGFGGGGGGGVR